MIKQINKILQLFNKDNNTYYYNRDTHYYTLYSQYDYLERLLNDNLNNKEKIFSDKRIQFGLDLDFGLSSKQIRNKLGRPHFVHNNKEVNGHRIYLYKRQIYRYRIKIEIHFFNDAFFLGIYNFNENPEEIRKIISEISIKYKIDPINFKSSEHQITDDINNILDIEINSNLILAYIDNSNYDIQLLNRIVILKKRELEEKRQNEEKKFKDFL